ncbi:hypothetical protein GCM10009079_05820 [Ralstonia mannitolilytica]
MTHGFDPNGWDGAATVIPACERRIGSAAPVRRQDGQRTRGCQRQRGRKGSARVEGLSEPTEFATNPVMATSWRAEGYEGDRRLAADMGSSDLRVRQICAKKDKTQA